MKGYNYSDAGSGWAHPEFESSVHPIPTRGTDYTHRITACPPGFENLAASLQSVAPFQAQSSYSIV